MPISGTALQVRRVDAALGAATTATFTATPTAGNLLIAAIAANSSSTFTVGPGAWTAITNTVGNAPRAFEAQWFWKESSGTEIQVYATSTAGPVNGQIVILEFPGTNLKLSSGVVNSSEVITNINSANDNHDTGTATNTNANSLVLAFFAQDNLNTARQILTYSNSFVEQYQNATFSGFASVAIASKVVSVSGANFCSATSNIAVANYGALAIFEESAGSTFTADTGYFLHTVTTLASQSLTGCLYNGVANLAVGDLIQIRNYTQSYSWSVSINSSGFLSLASGGDNRTDWLWYRIWDTTDATSGATATLVVTVSPVLSSHRTEEDGTNSASIVVTTNIIEGTWYTVLSSLTDTPTPTQIIAGQGNDGNAAAYAASIPFTTAEETLTASGLVAAKIYYGFATQVNAASLTSSAIASSPFTTLAAGDTTPDQFTFTDVISQPLDTEVTSNAITVTGIVAATAINISVIGGQYSVNAGSWTTAPGTVVLGDTVRVKHTTSTEVFTSNGTTLDINGVTDTFTSTTGGASGGGTSSAHDIFEWIYEQGYPGGMYKRVHAHLSAAGYSTGSINTRMFNWLRSLGYTGNLTRMIDSFERDNTIQHGSD